MKKTGISGSLYRLIYCSRNVMPMSDNTEDDLRRILACARQRNQQDNVTGALLYTVSGFAQVLEGPREVVERTFERIGADPRHTDVAVLSFTPTERRCFPEWSMGFCGQPQPSPRDPLAHLLAEATHAGPRAITGSDILRLLEKVVREEDRWVAA